MIYRFERQYPIFSISQIDSSRNTHIIALGSGHYYDSTLQALNRLGQTGLARVAEAVRIARQIPDSKIVCSGNSGSGRLPQAYTIAFAAIELGYSAKDTILLPSPTNTCEEAKFYARRFGTKKQVILVTSAYHMPRAIAYFARHGLNPIPAPTQHYVKLDPRQFTFDFVPSLTKIEMTDRILHELAGWLKFYLTSNSLGT